MPTSSALTLDDLPAVTRLKSAIRKKAPIFASVIDRNFAALGLPWAEKLDHTIHLLFPSDDELASAVSGYGVFAMDAIRQQKRFERTLEYENKTYEQVAEEVYHNDEYMSSCYLPGLLLAHYLWPHHYRQRTYFETSFIAEMCQGGATGFYDVGTGTGFYSRLALAGLPDIRGTGFDISESSRNFTEHHVQTLGFGDRYQVLQQNVLEDPPEPIDWLISVEILEHLEDPIDFLRGLRTILKPGGKAFITTALNAANKDHIYLYRRPEDVAEQLGDVGFSIEQYFCAPAYEPPSKGVPVPEVLAFIVT